MKTHDVIKAETWLKSLPGVTFAKVVTVTIGKHNYDAVHYRQTRNYNGEYTQEALYCLGEVPYRAVHNFALIPNGDNRAWYLASYIYADAITPDSAEFHPIGPTFQLMPCPNEHRASVLSSERTGRPYPEKHIRID